MFVVSERFLSSIVDEHGEYSVLTADGCTWYLQSKFLKLDHHIHFFVYKDEKSIIERTMQYIKDRIKECFDDYFPVEGRNVNYGIFTMAKFICLSL